MPDILLTTLNARYIHSAMGLQCLYANMGELQPRSAILEYTLQQRPVDIAEHLLSFEPKVIGFGVYIWNTQLTYQVIQLLKTVMPEITIIIGGPEVSYETEQQSICDLADVVISGQADHQFAQTCRDILDGKSTQAVITAKQPALDTLVLPYEYYTDDDIANRVIYVEASRGCPFKCEFCLSALDKTAWAFDLDMFLQAMEDLYQRGARHFKFVDRTFNLKVASSERILTFFLEKPQHDLFLHFELIPDNLPERLKSLISQFEPNTLQFEIGIQTFNPDIQTLISRRQDNEKTRENIAWLRQHSHAHLHTDLILGLPGETLSSIEAGFNKLVTLQPHEIQVGILKRLRGTPIIRHTDEYEMRYNPLPPYNILATRDIDFKTMQRLTRFARYWDLIANSGRFRHTLPQLLGDNAFSTFMQLTDWIYKTTSQTHKIALPRLFHLLYRAMTEQLGISSETSEAVLMLDYHLSGIKGKARFMNVQEKELNKASQGNSRQQRF